MEIFNALNLSQITGGTKLKQGDFGSVLSYSLADENGQEITSFDTKTAYINLVLDDKIIFTTTTQVDISRVTFHIDKAIPTGLYYLEIKIDDYIFPSDKDSVILIEEGSTAYDLKDLIPNYDVAMTITTILSDLAQKGMNITDLQTKVNAIYDKALSDHAEILTARGGEINLKAKLDAIESKESSDISNLQSNINGINSVLSTKMNNNNEVIGLRHLSQEVKTSITGGSTAVVGTNAVNTTNIADKAVTNVKLADDFANLGQLPNGTDYDFLIREGSYLVIDGTNIYYNYPPALVGKTKILNINVATTGSAQSNKFITQIARDFQNPKDAYVRIVQVSGSNIISKKDWASVLLVGNSNLDNLFLSGGVMANSTDLNNIFKEVRYLLIGDNYSNVPSELKGSTLMFTSEAYSSNFFIQKLTKTNSPTVVYSRTVQKTATNNIYSNWIKHYLDPSSSEKIVGKTIYNFGDSTIGNTNDATSVSSQLASVTGARTFNVGFGGCHMSRHSEHWDAFSMYRLADAIGTGDYTLQDAAIAANPSGMPAYFNSHLTLLKNADWANVDFITIGYGTNDYASGDLIDNPDNPKDTTTFLGAFRYSIETILNKYPHLKILVTTPMYRFWMNDDGIYKNDSDTVSYNTNNDTLEKFADAIVAESKKYHLPVLNLYNDLGVNKFNRAVYFPSNDGTHHNEAGRKRIAEKLASGLSSY